MDDWFIMITLHFRFLTHSWTMSQFSSFIYRMYVFILCVRRFWLRISTATLYFWMKYGKTQAAVPCFWESIVSWPSQIENLVAAKKKKNRTRWNCYATRMFRFLLSVRYSSTVSETFCSHCSTLHRQLYESFHPVHRFSGGMRRFDRVFFYDSVMVFTHIYNRQQFISIVLNLSVL